MVEGAGAHHIKLAVITYRCLHDSAPNYLRAQLCWIADIPARRRIQSCFGDSLDARPLRLTTTDDRVFATAAPHIWNCLLASVKVAQSLMAFRRQFKVHLFRQ
jgi:hypothetical protein